MAKLIKLKHRTGEHNGIINQRQDTGGSRTKSKTKAHGEHGTLASSAYLLLTNGKWVIFGFVWHQEQQQHRYKNGIEAEADRVR